jgi:cysteine desulfurase
MSEIVYLDNAASTAVDPRVVETMLRCLDSAGDFANPSATGHQPGRSARGHVERARGEVAALVGAAPEQVVWTSGATEADNLALLGASRYYRRRGTHLVTSRTEHPAVLDACRQLEREGFEVTYLRPSAEGIVEPWQVEEVLRADTVLVSLMHVNNEIGVVQDVAAVGRLCRSRGILFHVDAAQSVGKLPIDVERDCIDLLALTAHKVHGPKGVGALVVRREPRLGLVPLVYGGGQELGLRSGTVPTHQVAGMGAAMRIAGEQMDSDGRRIAALRERLWSGLAASPGVRLNGHETRRVPGILNVAFEGVEGESLLFELPGLAVTSGSACATSHAEPSYVLRSLGLSDRLAQSSLRLSLGRFSTVEDVDAAVASIERALRKLRAVASPESVR